MTFTAEATDVDLQLPEWAEGKTFQDTKSIEEEVDGEILSYEWDFGDGNTATTEGGEVSHTYEQGQEDPYEAKVTVKCDDVVGEDGQNEKAEATVTVKVLPLLKVSASASPDEGEAPLDVTFEVDASGGTGSYTYSWSGAVSGSGDSVSETFEEAGTYHATVTVTSGEQTASAGASAIVTKKKEEEEEPWWEKAKEKGKELIGGLVEKFQDFITRGGEDEVGPEITYKPGEKLTNPELKEKLKELGEKLGADKTQVTDGDRTPEENKKAGGVPKSQHMENKAADVKFYYKDGKQVPPEEVAKAAEEAGFGGIGNHKTYTHVDTRDLKPDGSPTKW